MPAATAAADPRRAPALTLMSHGLQVSPDRSDSVVGCHQILGLRSYQNGRACPLVALYHGAGVVHARVFIKREPLVVTVPCRAMPRSFSMKGTP